MKTLAIATDDNVLALATLDSVTKNSSDPISVVPPKVAKASTVTCQCHWLYLAKVHQGKYSLIALFLNCQQTM
jgi:hypothetical protein